MAPQKSAEQCKIFLNFMEKHPGLAKGFLKGDKVKQEQLWIDLANQLNACGPPSRDVANWKKTWCDWRRSIKTRLAENKCSLKKTGGGQFQQHFLSPVEEQLAIICGIFQTVDGVAMAKTFATQSKGTYFNCDAKIESETSAMVPNCENTTYLENLQYSPSLATSEVSPHKKKKRFDGDVQNLMGEEKKNFKYVATKIEEVNETLANHTKYLKNINRNLDELRSLKKKEIAEMKRHHLVLEKVALNRNDMKLELLKFERKKMGIPEE